MEQKKIIDNLNNAAKVLLKIIKSNSLPPDLEIETCNLRYDLLTLISSLQEPVNIQEEWQCP